MPDIVDPKTRSRMMSRIRGKNTKPELLIRKALHALGFRYRLHGPGMPGKPDMVFRRYRAVIFVHGCFWHGHDCHLFRLPETRREFWASKIEANRVRDRAAIEKLASSGWRVLTVWECAMRGRGRLLFAELIGRISDWLKEGKDNLEIRGSC